MLYTEFHDYRKDKVILLLFFLLKIYFQHYVDEMLILNSFLTIFLK